MWPFGVRARELRITHLDRVVSIAMPRLLGTPSGLRFDGLLSGGTLLGRSGLRGREGFLRFEALPLDALLLPGGFRVRGSADGVLRFGPATTFEAWVGTGFVGQPGRGLLVQFRQATLAATRTPEGAWNLHTLQISGPPISAGGTGTLGVDGEIQLVLRVSDLAEPLRTQLARIGGLSLEAPFEVEISGTLHEPRLRQIRPL